MSDTETPDVQGATQDDEVSLVGLLGTEGGPDILEDADAVMTPEIAERLGIEYKPEKEAAPVADEAKADDEEDEDPDDDSGISDEELGKRFREGMEGDRAKLIADLMGMLSDDEKAKLGVTAAAEASADDELTLPTDQDEGMAWEKRVTDSINEMRALKDLPKTVDAKLMENTGRIAVHVDSASCASAIALAQIEALAQVLGVELPQIPVQDVVKVATKTGKPWEEAVKSVAGKRMASAVAKAKQAHAPRPTTPGSAGAGAPKINSDDSMADIARKLFGRA